jgi:hypothetical protein
MEIKSFDDIISLKEVHKLDFINTNYLEFLTIYKDYIIAVYPFVIEARKKNLSGKSSIISYHHTDFNKGIIDVDPCDIYEKVAIFAINLISHISYLNIYNGKSDDYLNNMNIFKSMVIESIRNDKINTILNED